MRSFMLAVLTLVSTQICDVAAQNTNGDIIGMAVAACAAFALFTAVASMIVLWFQWKTWFSKWMRLKGKVQMPKAYFKKKKEIKRKLISRSGPSHSPSRKSHSRTTSDTATWVDDWRQKTRQFPPHRLYEEKDATVVLDEEVDDDFTIETEVLETSEVLDNVSNKLDPTNESTANGNAFLESNPYTTADSLRRPNHILHAADSKGAGTPTAAATVSPKKPKTGSDDDRSSSKDVKIKSFNDTLVHL